jgi:mannitol-1-phosphate 5-dehydrogenase
MLAVHFGAGNIGRGFIGSLLSQSGYRVCFVDINQALIEAINERNEYRVVHASDSKAESCIKDIFGLNSSFQPKEVVERIAQADLVTTAVGPNVLPFIAELIAKGISLRLFQTEQPLNVIACENLIGASTLLKEHVVQKLSEEERTQVEQQIGFPNCAVDRIVPDQNHGDPLKVIVEPFYEWVVDETAIVGEKPSVEGMTFVQELHPYIERKLYTVNTGHTAAAYLGYYYQHATIRQAMEQKEIREAVEGALQETGKLLIYKHGFNPHEHQQYIHKIIQRFENPYILDEVTRVGRGPIRKLGHHDRLIGPAKQIVDQLQFEPRNLVLAIAAALFYDNTEDNEARELQETIAQHGVQSVLLQYSGLAEEHDLVDLIVNKYKRLKR